MKRRDELANMATIREYFSIARLILILYINERWAIYKPK